MWFGTRNGLNRFDGTSFKVFQNSLSDTNSIGSNSVLSLCVDTEDKLWVGTYNGIYIYNPLQERFSIFTQIPAGGIGCIASDNAHNIWLIDNFVLYRYNTLQNKSEPYNFNNDWTVSLHISDIDSSLWVATGSGLIKHYDPESNSFTDFNIKGKYRNGRLTTIQDTYPLNDSLVLIGTMDKLLLFNYKTNIVSSFFKPGTENRNMQVHQIFRASPDEYWLATEEGICIVNIRTRQIRFISKEYGNPYFITDNSVYAICRDREGGIWAGTFFGGVNYYSKQYNFFRKYFPQPGKMSISGNAVHEICKDNYGHLWVGTEDAGLNCISLNNGTIRHFEPDGKKGSIAYYNIHGIVADGNRLWIGTHEHGLDVMDIATGKVVKHYNASSRPHSLTSNFIVSLYRTRDGTILAGTRNGLFRYNRKDDNFNALPFFNNYTQAICEAQDGTIWVGTYGNGVYYQNRKKHIQGHIKYIAGKAGGLPDNYVNNLYEDSKNTFWFCTENGLSHYNPADGKIKNYSTANGLPDNQVFRIMEDDNGNFWISTAKGLSMFNPKKNEFTNYHTANGLPTEQFNYNSSFKDDDGTLYFGTVKGMISFNPKDFVQNNFIPPVYITGLQINNREAVIGNNKDNLRQSILYTKSITLPYNSSNLSIDVAALSYIIPGMNQYAYKLEGIDKEWTIIKTNRKIFYTNLPPGKYTFRLKGSNSDGIWNNKETQLRIEILPPVWATVWAYLIYTLIAGTIIAVIIRYYHIATTEKHKRQIDTLKINTEREVYNAKINFFTNVAHEIRTPLTLIKMPLDKLLTARIEDRSINENLELMKKNTNRLIDLTNQLLDFRKAEADKFTLNFTKTDINELIEEVFAQFKLMAEEKNIAYKLELPRITLHAYVDNEAVRKILTNIFNNAVKYCKHSVLVKLLPFSSEDNFFFVEVQNDGNIISMHHKEKIFEPFFRIKETEKESGTGIGLPLARSLAQLHRGDLVLKTTEEQINVFILSLPIHQDIEINLHKFDDDKDAVETNTKHDTVISGTDKPLLLLVEDNREILYYMQKELSVKYNILLATNGVEALEILKEKTVQLVISDIMMPLMDGIELCKKIKTDLNYSHIPIILLTAKNSLQSKIEGLEVGADAYIEKPFSFEHLLAQINNLMSNRKNIREHFAHYPLAHIEGIASSKTDKEFLEQLNDAIYAHITDDKLDVDQLSSIMNMSKATLYRKIKGLSELTPNELINITRLKKAAELLASGEHKVNEVAFMVGYSHPSNFTRDFQKQFGIIPSAIVRN